MTCLQVGCLVNALLLLLMLAYSPLSDQLLASMRVPMALGIRCVDEFLWRRLVRS